MITCYGNCDICSIRKPCNHRHVDINLNFIDDEDKMRDFPNMTKEEFLESYSYLTEEEYDATVAVLNWRI